MAGLGRGFARDLQALAFDGSPVDVKKRHVILQPKSSNAWR